MARLMPTSLSQRLQHSLSSNPNPNLYPLTLTPTLTLILILILTLGLARAANRLIPQIFADLTQHWAVLSDLAEVEKLLDPALCPDPSFRYTGASVKAMRAGTQFWDQDGDSANELLMMSTMEAMVGTRQSSCST